MKSSPRYVLLFVFTTIVFVFGQDKAGNFIGYLFCEGSNLSVHLVTEGYASMHFTADRYRGHITVSAMS